MKNFPKNLSFPRKVQILAHVATNDANDNNDDSNDDGNIKILLLMSQLAISATDNFTTYDYS